MCSNRALSAHLAQLSDPRYDLGGPSSGRNPTARSAPPQALQPTSMPLDGDAGAPAARDKAVARSTLELRFKRASSATYRSEIRSRRPEQWTKPDGTLRPLRRHRSARRRRCATTLTRAPLRPKRYHPACSNRALSARVAQLTDRRYDLGGPSSGRNLGSEPARSARSVRVRRWW